MVISHNVLPYYILKQGVVIDVSLYVIAGLSMEKIIELINITPCIYNKKIINSAKLLGTVKNHIYVEFSQPHPKIIKTFCETFKKFLETEL